MNIKVFIFSLSFAVALAGVPHDYSGSTFEDQLSPYSINNELYDHDIDYNLPSLQTYPQPILKTYSAPVLTKIAAPVYKVKIAEPTSSPHYEYGYSVHDPHTGDVKSQHETRKGDTVHGSYSVIDPDGTKRTVEYTADAHHGFNAVVHKEPVKIITPVLKKIVKPITLAAPVAKISAPPHYTIPKYSPSVYTNYELDQSYDPYHHDQSVYYH